MESRRYPTISQDVYTDPWWYRRMDWVPHARDRMVLVGSDGDLWPRREQCDAIAAHSLFAVLVLWNAARQWTGWLTTIDHRRTQFAIADVEDSRFQRWLTNLPGWLPDAPGKLSYALDVPGLHLIWRRSRPVLEASRPRHR